MSKVVTFLHFSDIHFNKRCDAKFDPDSDVRNEMLNDAEEVVVQQKLQPYGIIICGDVAYSGKKSEYDLAEKFIKDLTDKLEIDPLHVFCVPGNHDVDQEVAKKSVSVYAVQKYLEEAKMVDFPNLLSALHEETIQENHDILYRGIKKYNDFAGKYMSNISPEGPWTHEIELDGGYKLCLYGINSTIISNADDHKEEYKSEPRKMRIGPHQIPKTEKKKIYMTVCHHPEDVWMDDVQSLMDERAMIQLYGHKHVHTLDASKKRVRIGTGALQPDRGKEGWQPRYNFLSLMIEDDQLKLRLYPRIWNDSKGWFEKDSKECDDRLDYKEVILSLNKPNKKSHVDRESSTKIRETPNNRRKLVYLLWGMPEAARRRLIGKYPVLKDISLDDLNQNISEFLAVAECNNLIDELVVKIENKEY